MHKKSRRPQQLGSFLVNGRQANQFSRMLAQQRTLLDEVRRTLPAPLEQHCMHARINDNTLILHTDSPAWTARLRFFGPRLVKQLQHRAPTLRTVRVLVHLPAGRPTAKKRKAELSPLSANIIRDAADSVSDPALQASLRRLSRHSG